MIKIKRVYEKPDKNDGYRIIVDRLWPRGIKKDDAEADLWLKDIAPGNLLRKWFSHDPEKWPEFKRRYFKELDRKKELVDSIKEISRTHKQITLVYGAKDEKYNNALALKEYLAAHP